MHNSRRYREYEFSAYCRLQDCTQLCHSQAEHGDYFLGMGLTAEEVAVKYNVSREDQDKLCLRFSPESIESFGRRKVQEPNRSFRSGASRF